MYKRILVPIDGSPTSGQALATAVRLAQAFGARLRLVHVLEEMPYFAGDGQFGGYSGALEALREHGNKILDEGIAVARAASVEADHMLFDQSGERLGETVAHGAKLWGAELIVVGTHGRRGVGRLLLGSGAEQIIRLAPVPVLVVRSTDSEPHPAN